MPLARKQRHVATEKALRTEGMPQTVFKGTAVFVSSLIGQRRDEFVEKIAMCAMDFDEVDCIELK